ncbi:MAG: OmpA family protein [Ginsengibacter sp.]
MNTGNYAGITGVSLQPASIVDSRHRFDINLISTDVSFDNNYFLVDKNAILKFNKNNFDSYKEFKDNYLSEASLGPNETAFFNVQSRVQLPFSFMATTGKKSAIAANLQFRSIAQGRGISTELANLAFNDFYYPPLNNAPLNASGLSINTLSWAEAGLTVGRVLYSSGNHFLKGAITGKYLAGVSSIHLASNNLNLQVNSDSTFNFASPDVQYSHSKNADFNNLFDRSFEPDANSFGLDVGLVYEYRGNIDKFKYIKSDDEKSYLEDRRDVNKYVFKLGVSLLDVGMFKFDKPANVNSFSANINGWDLKNSNYPNLKQFDTALANRVSPDPNDVNNYNVYLPTALSAQLDVKFVKGLFLNVMTYLPLKIGSEKGYRFNNYGFYAITPRYESRHFGIYFPYYISTKNDFTDYSRNTLGVTLRLGPLFFGSSNLPSMLFKDNLRGANVHVGLKVGFTYGKPTKSSMVMDKFLHKDQTGIANPSKVNLSEQPEAREINRTSEKEDSSVQRQTRTSGDNRAIVDYKNGQVYGQPNSSGNIIIVNNYYNSPENRNPGNTMMQSYPEFYTDSLYAQRMEIQRLQMLARQDSIAGATRDSLSLKRKQLDTLIRSMQELQKNMEADTSMARDRSMNVSPVRQNDRTEIDSVTIANAYAMRTDSAVAKQNDEKQTDSVRNSTAIAMLADTVSNRDVQKVPDSDSMPIVKKKDNATDNVAGARAGNDDGNAKQTRKEIVVQSSAIQPTAIDSISRNLQLNRQQQDKLYQQYAEQSARIANDINRLNERLSNTRQEQYYDRNADSRSSSYSTYQPAPRQAAPYYSQSNPTVRQQYIPYNNQAQPYYPQYFSGTSQQYPSYNNNQGMIPSQEIRVDTVYIHDAVTGAFADNKSGVFGDTVRRVTIEQKKPAVNTPDTMKIVTASSVDYTKLPAEFILFGLGKSEVESIYKNRLNFVATILRKDSTLGATITGHTDPSGSKKTNEWLSFKRAQTVADYLKGRGVGEKQMWVKSLSSEDPAVEGVSKAANSQNRRVEVKLVNR